MEFSVGLILLCLVIALFVIYVIRMSSGHTVFRRMGVPAPTPLPLIGNFHTVIKEGLIKYVINMYKKYNKEKVYGSFAIGKPTLYIRDLDMIRDICVKNFNFFVNKRNLSTVEPLNHALTNLRDDHWKNVRATVSPTFSTGKLKRMFHHIERNAKVLVEYLKEKEERNEEVELKDTLSCYTMDVIASTGFGVKIDSLKERNNQFTTEAKNIMNSAGKFMLFHLFFPFLIPIADKFGVGVFPKGTINYFKHFVDQTLESRRAMNDGHTDRHDFLQLVLDAQEEDHEENDNMTTEEANAIGAKSARGKLSYLDIQGQAMIFILAGYDTTATVLSFTLFLLAMNPECCKRAQEEIDEKLKGKFPEYDSVQALTYIDMCMNEATRLFPPGYALDRVCNEDVEIQGVHIPKGMNIAFPVIAIHMDPEYWSEPEKFIPERFTPENKEKRHPFTHLPFGQGPRNCIGMRLAQLEIKVALAAILQVMTPVKCSKSVYPVTLKPFQMVAEAGAWVKFETRK